jgi:hypothetical protein
MADSSVVQSVNALIGKTTGVLRSYPPTAVKATILTAPSAKIEFTRSATLFQLDFETQSDADVFKQDLCTLLPEETEILTYELEKGVHVQFVL